MKKSRTQGTFHVGGNEKKMPTLGMAISFAQTLACRADEPRQFGVFDNGTKLARVERHEDGTVTTTEV